MAYRAPVPEIAFLLEHVVGYDAVAATDRFAEATPDMVQAVLAEAGKLCDEVMAPLNRAGDLRGAVLENGVVRTSPGFAEGYRAIAEGGWVAVAAPPEHGGMGLPMAVATAINDMMSGACLALQLNPLLTQGQIDALDHHASDDLKALYLPKLISGAWSGTMNLTEPQAGSDVGALSTGPSRAATAPMRSPGRKSTSRGGMRILSRMSAIWCWRGCPTGHRGPRASACFWCRNTCPMRREIPALPMT